MKRNHIIFLALCLALMSPSLIWAQTPGEIVVQTVDRGLKILRDPFLQDTDQAAERRDKLWQELKPIFNFEETSKRALGRHWKERTPEEQKEFTQVFTTILKRIYLSKSDAYSGETIVYLRENTQGSRSKVQTNLITSDGRKILVDFSMKQNSTQWRIYDVIVEGVSIVGNYREQFNSILQKSSFEDLMEKLREKEKELIEL